MDRLDEGGGRSLGANVVGGLRKGKVFRAVPFKAFPTQTLRNIKFPFLKHPLLTGAKGKRASEGYPPPAASLRRRWPVMGMGDTTLIPHSV